MPEVGFFSVFPFPILSDPSYDLMENTLPGQAPVEMGISVNKTWLEEHDVEDINVYFKDPINNVPFVSPKENYLSIVLSVNLNKFFSLRFMSQDSSMTTRRYFY